jgi:hypothetical protein
LKQGGNILELIYSIAHGIQDERGNMGQIVVAENPNENGSNNQQDAGNEIRTISMFDWQY